MSQPNAYLLRMGIFVVAVAITLGVLYVALKSAFMANPVLNGVIVGILLIGILYNFRQVVTLGPAARWIDSFQRNQAATAAEDPPRVLASMATLLRDRDAGPLTFQQAIQVGRVYPGEMFARIKDEFRQAWPGLAVFGRGLFLVLLLHLF